MFYYFSKKVHYYLPMNEIYYLEQILMEFKSVKMIVILEIVNFLEFILKMFHLQIVFLKM
jgi:hypothetical protein